MSRALYTVVMVMARAMVTLRGQSVILRPWEPDDADWYVAARDEEIFRWTTEPRELTADQVRAAIEANSRERAFASWAITDAASGEICGNIAVTMRQDHPRTAEVMYWLAAAARGKGAATDAVRAAVDWAFKTLPIDMCELMAHVDNTRSQAVALRCGFAYAGVRGERALFKRNQ